MNGGAAVPTLDRRRFLRRSCGVLIGLLTGAPSLAARSEPRNGPPEAAFYRPIGPPQDAA